MLILFYDFLTQYIIPGMMLAFGICLFFLSIPDREGLENYIFCPESDGHDVYRLFCGTYL